MATWTLTLTPTADGYMFGNGDNNRVFISAEDLHDVIWALRTAVMYIPTNEELSIQASAADLDGLPPGEPTPAVNR